MSRSRWRKKAAAQGGCVLSRVVACSSQSKGGRPWIHFAQWHKPLSSGMQQLAGQTRIPAQIWNMMMAGAALSVVGQWRCPEATWSECGSWWHWWGTRPPYLMPVDKYTSTCWFWRLKCLISSLLWLHIELCQFTKLPVVPQSYSKLQAGPHVFVRMLFLLYPFSVIPHGPLCSVKPL